MDLGTTLEPNRPSEEQAVPFRVVTWNLNHWQQPVDTRAAGWEYVQSSLRADVALFQETVPPDGFKPNQVVYREIAGYRPWGSAVAAFRDGASIEELWAVKTPFSRRRFTLANTFPGAVSVAEVKLDGLAPITFVSVYNVIDTYAQTTLLRIIADLIPLFDSAKGSRVILGGDLNMALSTRDDYYLKRGRGILGALASLGLEEVTSLPIERPPANPDCPCGQPTTCRHIPTWKGSELDHLYVTKSLRDQVKAIRVDQSVVGKLSDHAPLILDLALSHEPAPRTWDCESFAAEIGRRHGRPAQGVVEALFRWATDKEVALRARGIRDVDLTRFPISRGASPELWFQIDYSGTVRALMYSISIKASGQVVVQFQWMRQPPFDTSAGRNDLREVLNRIEGVDLPEDRLSGRPSFPIQALEDPASLGQLMAVLDQIVDRTDPTGGPTEEGEIAAESDE